MVSTILEAFTKLWEQREEKDSLPVRKRQLRGVTFA